MRILLVNRKSLRFEARTTERKTERINHEWTRIDTNESIKFVS
jgi:hypothetical protein